MCDIRRTNVTFDIENVDEAAVYEAVQNQPHKQRSKYLLKLAYIGLTNLDNDDMMIRNIQSDISKIINMISGGITIQQKAPEMHPGTVSDVDEVDVYDIDESALEDMLGLMF